MTKPILLVAAAALIDRDNRVLISKRPEGRSLAGLWEFPGGKCEAGETAEEALRRELREELGIEIEIGTRLIRVPQAYPSKRLCLDVHEVRAWRGSMRGLEGQALAWVPPHMLSEYAMPPADIPVVAALSQPDRYLVTAEPGDDDARWLATLERALANGIRRVELRAPACEPKRWNRLASQAVACCNEAGAQVLINGDLELAAALGAGVHLRAAQLAELTSRPLPQGRLVGASCHTAEELRAAQALGCDFAVVGAIKPTKTHPEATPLGWEGFASLREAVSLPIYAIGGLGVSDIPEARRHGAQGIAAIRSLWIS